jgi:hypothetical protein
MQLRCIMYLFCAAAEDEDIQKKGFVSVVMNMGLKNSGILLDKAALLQAPSFVRVLPLRVDALHICNDKSRSIPANFAKLFPHLWNVMATPLRVRLRYYSGTCKILFWNLGFFQGHAFADEFSRFTTLGGFVEIFYQLKCFGIPTDSLPLDIMGEFRLEYHAKWYQRRQAIEKALHHENARQECTLGLQSTPYADHVLNETTRMSDVYVSNIIDINERRASSGTEAKGEVFCKSIESVIFLAKEEQMTPSDKTNKGDCIAVLRPIDVLMGREKLAHAHTGNMRYQFLIGEYQERYDACETRIEKTVIVYTIVRQIKENGGRFLSRERGDSNWSEADESVVNKKVSNAFRGGRRTAVARSKRSNDGTPETASKRRLPDVSQP